MASKIMVKYPVAPFGQVNKTKSGSVNADLVSVARAQDATPKPLEPVKSLEATRVAQLEQNIRFLQEQHQLMLAGLHHEVDSLRHRNRELQFQLVFAKTSLPSTPTTPEEDSKPKANDSPKQVNVTPLQVEILERELSDLRIQLQEAESRNSELASVVEEQSKKLEKYESERELALSQQPAAGQDPEVARKLDDAEALIRRLRRENSDLRKEGATSSSSPGRFGGSRESLSCYQQQQQQPGGHQQKGRGGRHRGHYRNWFPPVHSQNYWQSGRGVEKGEGGGGGGPLPALQGAQQGGGQHQGRRGGGGGGGHYHQVQENNGRKYRGGHGRANKQT